MHRLKNPVGNEISSKDFELACPPAFLICLLYNGFGCIIFFPSVLQAAWFEFFFFFCHEKREECCLSCPIVVLLPLQKTERLEVYQGDFTVT